MKSRFLITTAALAVVAILCQANAENASGSAQPQLHMKGMQLAQEKGAPGGGAPAAPGAAAPEGKGGAEHRGAPEKGAQRGMEKGGAEKGAAEKAAPEKNTQKTEGRDREKMTQDRDKGDRKASEKMTNEKNAKEHGSDRASGKGDAKGDAKNVHLDSKQETRVKTVIRSQKVTHIKRSEINFSISVGTRIPTSVHWYPVPVEIVEVVPEYRGYYYIIVDEDILIISPATREIVAVVRLA